MGIVFGQNTICPKCGGRQQIASREDQRRRQNDLARVRRIEARTGEPMERPPFIKSDCVRCGGKGYV